MKLILPAAGKGTRMTPATRGEPKELLPLWGRTVIEWVVRELPGASVCIVGSSSKPGIRQWAEARGACYREQEVQNGLGPALAPFLDGDEPVIAALPDTVFYPSSPTSCLAASLSEGVDIVVAVERPPVERLSMYGVCSLKGRKLEAVVEKPAAGQAPSRWAVAARYALSCECQKWMRQWIEAHQPEKGELGLTPALNAALAEGFIGQVIPLEPNEMRLDCGSMEGYEEAMRLHQ